MSDSGSPAIHASEIEFVSQIIRQAGKLALDMRQGVAVMEKAPGDFVTDADKAVSRMLVGALSGRFPGDLIVSEEGDRQQASPHRTWLIDPIDGTDHYMRNSQQFSVMVGILIDGVPRYGWVYVPTEQILYSGGPSMGAFKQHGDDLPMPIPASEPLSYRETKRIIIGRKDARMRPWLERMTNITIRQVGSIGVKVCWVIDDRADVVAQLHGRMKVWDTAGPAALALGAGLEVGTGAELKEELPFPQVYDPSTFEQRFPVVIGKPGSLDWSRQFLMREPAI